MINKFFKIFIRVSLSLILFYFLWFYPLIKFSPLKMVQGFRNELVSRPELLENELFINNLVSVLQFYDEIYRIDKGKTIYITIPLSLNKELIWNYTDKALDNSYIDNINKERKMFRE